MAGFDMETQRLGIIQGFGMIEGGEFDFSSGNATIDVATHMSRAILGFGIAKTNDPDFQGLVATTDGDITNGSITFARQTGFLDETLVVHYVLLGY